MEANQKPRPDVLLTGGGDFNMHCSDVLKKPPRAVRKSLEVQIHAQTSSSSPRFKATVHYSTCTFT